MNRLVTHLFQHGVELFLFCLAQRGYGIIRWVSMGLVLVCGVPLPIRIRQVELCGLSECVGRLPYQARVQFSILVVGDL